MLSGATIVDQAIIISKYNDAITDAALVFEQDAGHVPPITENGTSQPEAAQQRTPSAIASFLATGLLLADEAIGKAKAFDCMLFITVVNKNYSGAFEFTWQS